MMLIIKYNSVQQRDYRRTHTHTNITHRHMHKTYYGATTKAAVTYGRCDGVKGHTTRLSRRSVTYSVIWHGRALAPQGLKLLTKCRAQKSESNTENCFYFMIISRFKKNKIKQKKKNKKLPNEKTKSS